MGELREVQQTKHLELGENISSLLHRCVFDENFRAFLKSGCLRCIRPTWCFGCFEVNATSSCYDVFGCKYTDMLHFSSFQCCT